MNTAPESAGLASRALEFARTNRARFVAELGQFVRFPSISAQPGHAADVRSCAAWLADHLLRIGMEEVRRIPTRGHPIVQAQWLHALGRPTVLIYGHYDVQPSDPLNEWRSPPFEPVVHGHDMFGRGASDDKGQMFAHVKALEAWLRTSGRLPVNVKCLFEGEEEIGSPNLEPFLARNRGGLAADAAVLSDAPMRAPNRPALIYALRGALSLELEVSRLGHDLHSGNFGGAVANPLDGLCAILSGLRGHKGRIAIPGFYDRVHAVPARERARLARAGPSPAELLKDVTGAGEPGFTPYERTTIRPALTITGMTGGYQGPGPKAVIPTRAAAKLDLRLVPDQQPVEIARLVRARVRRLTPAGLRATMRVRFAARPAFVDRRDPAVRAAATACRLGFGAGPVLLRLGGTIPVVGLLQDILCVPVVLMGFGLDDDRIHAPNERFHLPNFDKGIATSIWFLAAMAETRAERHAEPTPANVGALA